VIPGLGIRQSRIPELKNSSPGLQSLGTRATAAFSRSGSLLGSLLGLLAGHRDGATVFHGLTVERSHAPMGGSVVLNAAVLSQIYSEFSARNFVKMR